MNLLNKETAIIMIILLILVGLFILTKYISENKEKKLSEWKVGDKIRLKKVLTNIETDLGLGVLTGWNYNYVYLKKKTTGIIRIPMSYVKYNESLSKRKNEVR